MEIKTFVRKFEPFPEELTFSALERGWGCGYALIPKGHVCYGKDIDDDELIQIDVHGGLTLSRSVEDSPMTNELYESLTDEEKEGWVVGFDTGHFDDNLTTCPKEYVEKEAENLKKELLKLI